MVFSFLLCSEKRDEDGDQNNRVHRQEAVYGDKNKGFGRFLANNKTLNTSEFGSGISTGKKNFNRN